MEELTIQDKKIIEFIISLRNKISESMRAEKKNIEQIKYVDFNNNLKTIISLTNFVIFGRRGSGKTMLMRNLEKECLNQEIISCFIDCEMAKEYSYPNIVIYILLEIMKSLEKFVESKKSFFVPIEGKRIKEELRTVILNLGNKIKQPDNCPINNKEESQLSESESINAGIKTSLVGVGCNVDGTSGYKLTREFKEVEDKLNFLDQNLPIYKSLIDDIVGYLKMKRIFIILDDFYFIKRDVQYNLADYIHKLCKNSLANFRLATIRHRSNLYERGPRGTFGIQEGADYRPVDLDYTLDRPELTEQFMSKILKNFLDQMNSNYEVEDLFIAGPNGFKRIVWASGGVPRDFLNILIYILDEIILENKFIDRIGKDRVNSGAQKYFSDKQNEFQTSAFRNGDSLKLFQWIYDFCIENKKITAFLIQEGSFGTNGLSKMFNDLIDLRLIHLVRKSETKKKISGEVFQAYILDIGAYASQLRLKKGIEEIDIFSEYKRKGDSEFRSKAPVLNPLEFKLGPT